MNERKHLEHLAAALTPAGEAAEVTVVDHDLFTVRTATEVWQVEPMRASGSFVPSTAYRVFTARPAVTVPRVRGLAQLPDGRTFPLDDARGVSAFAATGGADPAALGCLAALFADAEDRPRRLIDTVELQRVGAQRTVVTLHTTRLDVSEDEETPHDVVERWTVTVEPHHVSWTHVPVTGPLR